jgi:hypothetical protein
LLAVSTRCAPASYSLDRAVASLKDFRVPSVVLHRAPEGVETRALTRTGARIVAVFSNVAVDGVPTLVVEGGPADADDRQRSLLALCRRLHALRGFSVALRASRGPDDHPAPEEIDLIRGEVAWAGYWHEPDRAGAAHLDAGARWLLGASFHPLEIDDLGALRAALPAAAPAVVDCPHGTSREEVAEAVARAGSYFGA